MPDDEHPTANGWRIDRRSVLRSIGVATATGLVGVPTVSGSALATDQEVETCGELDIVCAIDTSGSLNSTEISNLEDGVNGFIDELPIDGSVQVGSLEFGNNGVRNKNDLQDPDDLTVNVGSPGGNTPMPGALDIADQALYGDAQARAGAIKLVVLFTDGGPNYANTSYSAGGSTAPRDDSDAWSATAGNDTYDNADTASATVSRGEMDETALVASSMKDASIGGGSTLIATVYVGEDDTEAMTVPAIDEYTDLPTYLKEDIASSESYAIDVDVANIQALVDELVTILQELCCVACPDGFYVKYEWVTDDTVEGDCEGEFTLYDEDDQPVEAIDYLELVSVSCDEDGEPVEACFETTLCAIEADVKAGRDTETTTFEVDETGETFCVSGIEDTNPAGKSVTYAISNVVFTCPEEL